MHSVSGIRPQRLALHVYDKLATEGATIHGGARLLSWVLPRLIELGYRSRLVCLQPPGEAARILETTGVPVHCLGRGRYDPRIVADLLREIRMQRASVLHTHGYAASNYGRIAARIAGVPVIVHEHFVDDAIPLQQRIFDRLVSPLTSCGLAVSRAVAGFMSEQRHMGPGKLLILKGGVPLEEFRPRDAAEGAALRAALGIDPDALVVGAVGRLAPVKGLDVLLDAWPQVIRAHPGARLLLVGDGPERENLQQQAKNLGISESLVFAGHQQDIPRWLAAMDVFAMPSRSEGLGMALIEAMAARIPVVASFTGGIPDIVEDGSSGLLVPPADAIELGRALTRVLDNADLRAALVQGALDALPELDARRYAEHLADLYNHLASQGRGAVGVRWLLGALHLIDPDVAAIPGFQKGSRLRH